jgi:hypothetical protein
MIIELHYGSLYYYPTKVIYKKKEFKAPIDIIVLMSWDYICTELLNKRL